MGFGVGPASSFGGALGLPGGTCDEGTCPSSRCQCGQPSTSTSGLRVAAGDGAFRDCDIEVCRPARGWGCERGDDAVRNRDLERQVDGCAEADFETAAQPERDLAVECTDEGHASGEAAAHERGEGARCKTAVGPAKEGAELDRRR